MPETYRQPGKDTGIVFGPIPEPPHRHPRLHAILPHLRGLRSPPGESLPAGRGGAAHRLSGRSVRPDGGRVGVEATREGGAVLTIRARQAVILAAGDFSSADRGFKARFLAPELLDVEGGQPDQHRRRATVGEAAGGEVVNGDLVWGRRSASSLPPRPALVNRLPLPAHGGTWAIGLAMAVLPEKLLRPFLASFATTLPGTVARPVRRRGDPREQAGSGSATSGTGRRTGSAGRPTASPISSSMPPSPKSSQPGRLRSRRHSASATPI
ncbi:MAG: hypothetical protein R3D25_21335 [Geminicoccaceae bacterium]